MLISLFKAWSATLILTLLELTGLLVHALQTFASEQFCRHRREPASDTTLCLIPRQRILVVSITYSHPLHIASIHFLAYTISLSKLSVSPRFIFLQAIWMFIQQLLPIHAGREPFLQLLPTHLLQPSPFIASMTTRTKTHPMQMPFRSSL